MVVLDTHILIWWLNGSACLSKKAAKTLSEVSDRGGNIIVSSISAWEIAMLIKKRRLVLSMETEAWLHCASQIEGVYFQEIDNDIAIKSTMLPGDFHRDPADRLIVATARKLAAPLITADKKIINYPHVETIY